MSGTSGAAQTGARPRVSWGLSSLRTYGLVIAIALVSLYFYLQNPAFAKPENIFLLLRAMSSLALIAFAQLLVIITGELDLSVGSIYGLSAVLLAVLWLGAGVWAYPLPFVIALVIALAVAVGAGAVNAFFTTIVGIPAFIATLGMLSIAQGLELLISRASTFNAQYNVPPPSDGEFALFRSLGYTTLPGGIPIQVVWLALFFGIFWVIRHRTLFGFRLLAIGGNVDAARVTRLPVVRYKWIVFMVCAFMAGLAGILDFSFVGSVGPNGGQTLTFPVFAAVVIGGASLAGGRGTVFGTLMGAVLLAVLRNGLAIMGVSAFAQLIVVGMVTIGAVTVDVLSQKAARRAQQAAR